MINFDFDGITASVLPELIRDVRDRGVDVEGVIRHAAEKMRLAANNPNLTGRMRVIFNTSSNTASDYTVSIKCILEEDDKDHDAIIAQRNEEVTAAGVLLDKARSAYSAAIDRVQQAHDDKRRAAWRLPSLTITKS